MRNFTYKLLRTIKHQVGASSVPFVTSHRANFQTCACVCVCFTERNYFVHFCPCALNCDTSLPPPSPWRGGEGRGLPPPPQHRLSLALLSSLTPSRSNPLATNLLAAPRGASPVVSGHQRPQVSERAGRVGLDRDRDREWVRDGQRSWRRTHKLLFYDWKHPVGGFQSARTRDPEKID